MPLLLFSGIGWGELALVLLVLFLIFGARKFPEIMRSLGKGVNEFKRSLDEGADSGDKNQAPPPEEEKKPE
ncbi:MAG TPA: twin-arginine translocase TatA/TatE family subunit [bacterium]|nr:twin-arginine translocase TatA/TatE family subunit [bacterium]HPJ72147.1 twin-arginine translocase TatA/TatE family subunit [bacterium]HPQ66275.1 twin-arginine translocase TatA/TatE family subunit [bacterium]